MLKLVIAVAAASILLAVSFALKTEATPLTGAADSLAVLKPYSAVQKAGCMFGTARCPAGTKHACVRTKTAAGVVKKCLCRPC
jgi:Mn2+/Fe2+ NRAMP family transporter